MTSSINVFVSSMPYKRIGVMELLASNLCMGRKVRLVLFEQMPGSSLSAQHSCLSALGGFKIPFDRKGSPLRNLLLSATRSRGICNRRLHPLDRDDLQLSPTSFGRISNPDRVKRRSRSAPFCHGSGLDLLSARRGQKTRIRNYPQPKAEVSATKVAEPRSERRGHGPEVRKHG
jgi:hypothetical protein